jgi:hypothetical protein
MRASSMEISYSKFRSEVQFIPIARSKIPNVPSNPPLNSKNADSWYLEEKARRMKKNSL